MSTLNSTGSKAANNNDGNYNHNYRSDTSYTANDHDVSNRTSSTSPLVASSVPIAVSATSQSHDDEAQSPIISSKRANHHFYYEQSYQEDVRNTNEKRRLPEDDRFLHGRFHDDADQHLLHDSIVRRDHQHRISSPMVTPPSRNEFNAIIESSTVETLSNEHPMSNVHHTNIKMPPSTIKNPVTGVPHVYHDYSQSSYDETTFIRKKTGGVSQPFPEKLHEMLSTVDGTHEMNIVSWLPHGRAFIVRKPKEFTDVIMPK
jgi:hypothetical protein